MSRSNRPYHHGHLAEALEAAALEVLDRTGHAAVSLREVARIAGVSHNAPYHHFGDRTDLLHRLAELCMAELVQQVREAQDAVADAERVLAIGRAYAEYARTSPHRFGVIFDPEVCIPGEPAGEMVPLIAEIEQLLDAAVRAAHPDFDADAVATASAAAWATAHGLATLVIAGHIPAEAVQPALEAALA